MNEVFVGVNLKEHFTFPHTLEGITANSLTGISLSLVANRISFSFDLHGPSLCVATACSGSATAFHIACKAVQDGECEQALVAGTFELTKVSFIASA